MDAKSLLKGIEVFLNHGNLKTHVLPVKGDPTKPQNKVSLMIMEKAEDGEIPRFIIHVEDMEAIRKEKNG
jgi:hypothetical protein